MLQVLPDKGVLALAAAKNLISALPCSIAVVRAEDTELNDALAALGLKVQLCCAHEQQMADSLVAGVRYTRLMYPQAQGIVLALADMPYIREQTIAEIAQRIKSGAGMVVPTYAGTRGHPVGFSARFSDELSSLQGDRGARSLFEKYPSELDFFKCDDAGILVDIDTPADILKTPP